MSDRAQLGRPRWLPVSLTCAAVLAVVIAEVWEEVGAVEGPVEYCGLCHVDWRPAAALLIIGGLVAVVSLVARSGVAPTVFRGDSDE
jgi:hypothetical protein